MPKDIFGSDTTYKGNSIITAADMIMAVTLGTDIRTSIEGALIQQVTIQFEQPIQILREVGSRNYYYYAQPSQGTLSFGRLVSADKHILSILPKNTDGANIWEVPKNSEQICPNIVLRHTLEGPNVALSNLKYICYQCIVTNLGVSTFVDNSFVQEQVTINFGSFQMLPET